LRLRAPRWRLRDVRLRLRIAGGCATRVCGCPYAALRGAYRLRIRWRAPVVALTLLRL
jgi:hypothetical protein